MTQLKKATLLATENVRLKDANSIIHSFALQSEINTRVSKPVCHISLSFSQQDKEVLTDAQMFKITREYMKEMGIENTQYVIARHHDKEHPHCHIVFNRVGNDGKTISDSNDRVRSTKVCLELTKKHGLYLAPGKENVKLDRLKEPDKTKYEIFHALSDAVPRCRNWSELQKALSRLGIAIEFKTKGSTDQIEGIKFSKNGYQFSGSKVDQQFSFSKIDYQLKRNDKAVKMSPPSNLIENVVGSAASMLGGLGGGAPSLSDDGELPDYLSRYKKKKKKRPKGIAR